MAVLLAAGTSATALGSDVCSTATVVVAGVPAAFDTTTATASPTPSPDDSQCPGTFLDWGTDNPDRWFRFTPAENGTATFSTCSAGGFDTSMVLYTGTCAALTQVACNGDGTGETGCQAFYSRIAGFPVVGGTTYFIRIGGWQGETGTGALSVSFTGDSDVCGSSAGSCSEPHGGLGCSTPACCTAVCAVNPLCCDLGWDQSCVETAIAECGIFVYSCTGANPAVPNDCAPNATVIASSSSVNFNLAGCNSDGPNDPTNVCQSANLVFFNSVWYRVQASANGTLRANTCGVETFDTKIAIYNLGSGNPASFDYNLLPSALVGCNDFVDCPGFDPSDITVNVQAGNWYLIRLAAYETAPVMTGAINFTLPVPCQLGTPTGSEGEPCGENTNGGCNSEIPATTPISPGQTIAGTFWADGGSRDTDWYSLSVGSDQSVTVTVKSSQFNRLLVLSGACGSTATVRSVAGSCGNETTACLSAGNYFLFVAMVDINGNAIFEGVPCGSGILNDYTISVSATPANCPVLVDQVCSNPGVSSYSSSTAAVGGGLVACAANPAFPTCAAGGTGDNTYARPMPAGAIGGSITCLNFGAFSVRRGTNAANNACVLFGSDLPLPATIGVYEDIDGGAPRNKILEPGDGNDLRLIAERQVLIPGGAFLANLEFDPPLCLEGVVGNIVVVMDCPSFLAEGSGIPVNAGYQIRPSGGAVAGENSGTYVRLSCADAAQQYVLAETLGATFTAQWVVSFNGDFSGCSAGNCPTDIDGDGVTGASDLSALLNGWGTASPDLDGDGTVGASDLSTLLNGWGACP